MKRTTDQIKYDLQTHTKVCAKCSQRKSFDDYYTHLSTLDKRGSWCKNCLQSHRDERKEESRAWHRENYRKNKEDIRSKRLFQHYGVDSEWYRKRLAEQQGSCAICKSPYPKSTRSSHFHVDHNHNTGKARGLLCTLCNTALGKFQESEEILKNAIEYLKQFERKENE